MSRVLADYYAVDPEFMPDGWCPACEHDRREEDLVWSDHHQNLVCDECVADVPEEEDS